MKIIFERSILEKAVEASLCSVSEKNTIPVVEGIRFRTEKNKKCSITTYDLEKGFRTEIECQIIEPGNYVISASKLIRIIRMMPDLYITMEVSDKCSVTVSSGRSKFELHAMEGDAFPNLPELSGDRGFAVEGKLLKKMLSQVSFAISVSDQRPMLCGAFFTISENKMRIVCCDGNRLAVRECSCPLENRNKDGSALDLAFIVPGKTVAQLFKLIDDEETVTILLARKHVIFRLNKKVFFSRLIDYNYVDYERVIPKTRGIVVKANRMELVSSLERASLITEDRALGQAKSYVKCSFEGELLKLESVSVSGSVYDDILIEHEGEDLVMGFNCRYLLDALRGADTEKVEIVLNAPLVSIIILPVVEEEKQEQKEEQEEPSKDPSQEVGHFLYMVSPVKMRENS
jgi:DNA polymerase-3 subunit beta